MNEEHNPEELIEIAEKHKPPFNCPNCNAPLIELETSFICKMGCSQFDKEIIGLLMLFSSLLPQQHPHTKQNT
jgi:hypothetical protein